MIRQNFDVT